MSDSRKVKGYDPQCGDLARYFLGDKVRTELVQELAQHIQDEVEDWLNAQINIKRAIVEAHTECQKGKVN
jgi:hypothetical protein